MNYINSNNEKKPEEDFKKMNLDDQILTFTSSYSVPDGLSKEVAFEILFEKIESDERLTYPTRRNHRYIYLTIAATLLILTGIFFVYQSNRQEEIIAANGSHVEYRLPDGSNVILNSGSSISFAKYGFSMNRHIMLKGEAFFDVIKGDKFLISTENGEVKVLGTTLNVISRQQIFKVSCLTGKVMVNSGSKSEILTPGETVEKFKDDLQKSKSENIERLASWRNGQFYFENTPLHSIFEEIERQFNVKLEIQDIENRFFSGNFSNKNLTETLDIVCIPMELEYDIQTDKTIIVRKGK